MADKVLIVDDEPDILIEVKEYLEDGGYPCLTAGSAEQALDLLADHAELNIVLSDVCMPGMDGLAFVSAIKNDPKYLGIRRREPQFIFYSGSANLPMAQEAIRLEAVDFLSKPFEPEDLISAIRRAIDKRKLAATRSRRENEMADAVSSLSTSLQQVTENNKMLTETFARFLPQGRTVPGQITIGTVPARDAPKKDDPESSETGAEYSENVLIGLVRKEKALRASTFGEEFAGEDYWAMIMELFLASIAGEAVPVTALCASSEGSQTTALRRIDKLIQNGLISKVADPNDRRRSVLALSDQAQANALEYLKKLDSYLRLMV